MAKPKMKFLVYSQYYFCCEDYQREDSWKFEGETWAVSEKQAINNVRHRNYGDYGTSQYKPIAVGGHWENGLNYKAILYKEEQKHEGTELQQEQQKDRGELRTAAERQLCLQDYEY